MKSASVCLNALFQLPALACARSCARDVVDSRVPRQRPHLGTPAVVEHERAVRVAHRHRAAEGLPQQVEFLVVRGDEDVDAQALGRRRHVAAPQRGALMEVEQQRQEAVHLGEVHQAREDRRVGIQRVARAVDEVGCIGERRHDRRDPFQPAHARRIGVRQRLVRVERGRRRGTSGEASEDRHRSPGARNAHHAGSSQPGALLAVSEIGTKSHGIQSVQLDCGRVCAPRRGRVARGAAVTFSPASRPTGGGAPRAAVGNGRARHVPQSRDRILRAARRRRRPCATWSPSSATRAAIAAGEHVQASGTWVTDRTHGRQFRCTYLNVAAPDIEARASSATSRPG